jgi:hypothetical protein
MGASADLDAVAKKKISLPLPGPNLGRPAHIILTEISRLHNNNNTNNIYITDMCISLRSNVFEMGSMKRNTKNIISDSR